MTADSDSKDLRIKKYANRRFYDTTRSCHVTLGEMYDRICEGYELHIVDGKSGDDITNLVLTQIILERDPPKLGMLPSNILHQMIRTQQHLLGGVVEQFFAQVLESHKASQDQWFGFLKNTLGVEMPTSPNPLDWTRSLMQALTPASRPKQESNEEIDALRRQVEELTRHVARMSDAETHPERSDNA